MMIQTLASRPGDDLFHFHPRSTNPELWRTTVPLIVRERCGRHKGLIATWIAIHWLIVLHAASGRAHFGMREIAEEAGVGRNELAGPAGHIQRLVSLGLLRIVGYKSFKGLREPRPIYHVDLAELERQSLELVPEVLRDHHIDRPPPAAPDPRQLRLFPPPPEGGESLGKWTGAAQVRLPHADGPDQAEAVRSLPAIARATHQSGTEYEPARPHLLAVAHESVIAGPENGTVRPQSGTERPEKVRPMPSSVPASHEKGTEYAPEGDIDRTNDRTNEGERQALTPDLIQKIIAQAAQAVLITLGLQAKTPHSDAPVALTTIPSAPPDHEPLPAAVLALWQGDEPALSRRDTHQLAIIAAEYDRSTGGHGAYWLGRAILMADLCLGERGQARSLAYLRRILRRWREEGSWGSDREAGEALPQASAAPFPSGAREPEPRDGQRATPAQESPRATPAHEAHPAVRAYVEALHEAPNAVQAAQIAATVTDLAAWRQVLIDWQLNGWGERSVGKMLDRYQKSHPAAVEPKEPPVSVVIIHRYPGLTDEQRDRWIGRFHAALSPAEKRAVIKRLEQEHPR
jgi:hypothetical protein